MAAPLKRFFSPDLVRRMGRDISRVHPPFPVRRFQAKAANGLEELELMDRGRHIGRALADCLPASYPAAIDVLLRSLGPEHASEELVGAGMAPFFYLPHTIFVMEHGLDDFETSMRAQYELTKRFSAEMSIRPFIAGDPERTMARLREWAGDPSPHVRRLVSEGTRLRLPWAARVGWLEQHPDRVVALLELLKDDPASVVRRSVGNSLNDLGKVHPDLLFRTCAEWLTNASPARREIIEHGLRSAVKRGHPEALRLLGYGEQASVAVEDGRISPRRVAIGGRVLVTFALRSRSPGAQHVLVNFAVHFVKANGRCTPKVFKLKRVVLEPGERAHFSASVSLAVHTTRTPHRGRHAVDVIVNGRALALGAFDVI